jgi:hypothetical protein
LKKKIHVIGTRTHNLPACSIVPQQTKLPRDPWFLLIILNFLKHTKLYRCVLTSQCTMSKKITRREPLISLPRLQMSSICSCLVRKILFTPPYSHPLRADLLLGYILSSTPKYLVAFPTAISYAFLVSPMRSACLAHLILLHLMTLIVSDEEYK